MARSLFERLGLRDRSAALRPKPLLERLGLRDRSAALRPKPPFVFFGSPLVRHALRRFVWMVPTLVGVSLAAFLFLSFVPDRTDDPKFVAEVGSERAREMRRERFLDLPRLVNSSPRDVRSRAEEAMDTIAADGPDADEARRELARLGGAALPHIIPALDRFASAPRGRVALALAPIARRMGLVPLADAEDPERAPAFWLRFWNDRGPEFRAAPVRSTVRRLSRYGGGARAADIIAVDTFAFEHLAAALEEPSDFASIVEARVLVDLLAHVTGRDDIIRPGADLETARACVHRWIVYATRFGTDYVTLTGASRIAAVFTETRYGRWLLFSFSERVGRTQEGVPVLTALANRARVTLTIVFGAIALAYLFAIPLGLTSAMARRGGTELGVAAVGLGLYALPTAIVAALIANAGAGHGSLVVPTLILSLGLIAAPAGQQRAAMRAALVGEHVRAARARGVGAVRAVLVHGWWPALIPTTTLMTLEVPMALGGAFVLERVFGLGGLGEATLRAVDQRDIAWLMAFSLLTAAAAAIGVFLTDLFYAIADPRTAAAILTGRRRS